MSEEPKVDLEALTARLRSGVDRSVAAAESAQNEAQAVASVSSAPETKSEPRVRGVRRGENGDEGREKLRVLWIEKTERAITKAKNLEQLMSLAESVKTGKGKMKLSLRLPDGLLTLLKNSKDFSREFNVLFDRWSERVVGILFDEAEGVPRFQNFLRDVIVNKSGILKGRFFDTYLERSNLSALRNVPAITTKMNELWKQYLPDILGKHTKGEPGLKREDSSSKLFRRLMTTWKDHQIPFSFINEKDGKKLTVTSMSDNRLEYDYQESAASEPIKCHIIPSQIIDFLKGFNQDFGIDLLPKEKNTSEAPRAPKPASKKLTAKAASRKDASQRPLDIDDAIYNIRNANGGLDDDEMMALKKSQLAFRGKKVSTSAPAGQPDPDNMLLLPGTYEDLLRKLGGTKREATLEKKRLEGVVAAGLQKITEAFPDDGAAMEKFVEEHKTDLVAAFSEGIMIRLGRLSWTLKEKVSFASSFTEKFIEDFMKN